jgi:hypothetical protein
MRRRHIVLGFAAVLVIAAALPAFGAPHLGTAAKKKSGGKSGGGTAARALKIAKQAKKNSEIAQSVSTQALAEAKLPGPPGATGKTGSNGKDGSARAFAEVSTPGASPTLVSGRTKNFTTVIQSVAGGTGIYCLTLDPASNIDASKVAAVASAEATNSTIHGGNVEVLGAVNTTDCPASPSSGQLELKTYDAAGTSLVGTVAFNVIVP